MKTLVLCERIDAEGGTESYLRALLPALAAAGDEVLVVARSAAQPDAYGVPSRVVAWSDEHDSPSALACDAVDAIARAFAPDVVAAHNVLDAGVLAAARARAPRLVYHLHDHRPFCPNGDRLYPQGGAICAVPMSVPACGFHSLVHGCAYGPRPRTLSLIRLRETVARAVRGADEAIAFSAYMAALARRNGAVRARVVAPPLASQAFASAPVPRPPLDAVLFAGRVMPSKGARSLVRALARLPSAVRPELRIAGEGPELSAVLDDAASREVRVRRLGRLDEAALRAAYDDATIVAMPSTWGEPYGLVGIEAFARGRPVVAYDSGGIGEWLADGAGRLIRRLDEPAFADAIASLLDATHWTAASGRAYATATKHRLAPHVARIRQLYAGSAS
jgi:glycosyltransferase involved in cell wall biosynthesis